MTALVEHVIEGNPMHRRFIESSLETIRPDEMDRLEAYLEFCVQQGVDIPYLARSYLTVVVDTRREQIYFAKHGRYRHSSFAEVADDVYFDADYMNRYMYGLALTSFLWPNHLELSRFFDSVFPLDRPGRYLEVGPGHGYYMMTAMQRGSFSHHLGIDISQASVAQTRAILRHLCPGTEPELRCVDFLAVDDLPAGSFDAIVMGEVLEHVEQPRRFLQRIHELAAPGAFVFVTTCVNAPAVDHISLWRSTDELEEQIVAEGFRIAQAVRVPYQGKTLAEAVDEALAINVAYVLEPRR